jgi:hypothetical protein
MDPDSRETVADWRAGRHLQGSKGRVMLVCKLYNDPVFYIIFTLLYNGSLLRKPIILDFWFMFIFKDLFLHGAIALSGLGPPHRGFTITFTRTALDGPLYELSARSRNL